MTSADEQQKPSFRQRISLWLGQFIGGEFGLPKTIWLGLIGGSFVLMPFVLGFIGGLISILSWFLFGNYRLALGVMGLLFSAYWIAALIGTWNAATKYEGDAALGYAAKIAVVILGLFFFSQLPARMEMIMGFLTSR